ncbi:EamA family transporter RarD [Niveibacterium microcysteis]|uniref:EamA family transporter RarD n=1 Tax=Niveibacterium microcysteis TaxID=2811415 RepID=A0ABX7M898_9RHOO|nr:EamA family transporter RarD [Niveibacterium microcysteis]QSI76675.1 EamA family transporter RarD [Niveibacterium microcysteis]
MSGKAARTGLACALGAFSVWGLSPLYFHAVGSIPAGEIVAHRVVWSVLLLAAWIGWRQGYGTLRSVFGQPRLIALLALTASLTSLNWLVFVWSVGAGRLVESSLGYFINPLVNVLFGRLFLGERLRPLQRIAVAIATAGVALKVWQTGQLPWIALFLAGTFGTYGLLRKRAPIDAQNGLFIETLLVAPIAIGYLGWLAAQGDLHLGATSAVTALLPFAGVMTTIPLALFAEAARRLPLSTVGLVQYLSPTLNFLIAVWVFGEAFRGGDLAAFGLIWAALALYSADALRAGKPATH